MILILKNLNKLKMKITTILISMITSVAGFCNNLPGSILPIKEFDPLGFSSGMSKQDMYLMREAELMHGRVGMMASAGFLTQEIFHPMFDGKITGPSIDHIPQLPVYANIAMTIPIVFSEAYRINKGWDSPSNGFQALKPNYYPGDLGFDPLNLYPKTVEKQREMQTKELQNGRLGMLAAAGFLAQETFNHQPWLQ